MRVLMAPCRPRTELPQKGILRYRSSLPDAQASMFARDSLGITGP